MNRRRPEPFSVSDSHLDRRAFLRRSLWAAAGAGLVMGHNMPAWAAGECALSDVPRTLVNVMLQGGADLRYLFMPAPEHPDGAYIELIWGARRSLYDASYANFQQMFDAEYLRVSDPLGGVAFGVHRVAGWLADQFSRGNVAVVANAYCSRNRRHDQSILNADAGEPELNVLNFDRSGWGGRLVELLGDGINSVELGESVSTFNKGSIAGERLRQVVHAQDMRDIALASVDDGSPASRRNVLARALGAYYQGRGAETADSKPANWPYHTFFRHHDALREFGDRINARLGQCLPLPDALAGLQLASEGFAQQCRNLFDVCQVPDALNLGVLSMSYGGWDTHNNQAAEIGRNLGDLFGEGAGLATALDEIGGLPYLQRPARKQLVFCFASDFGRQIVANGAAGTDHGRGTYSILLGEAVRGGVYGELFPQREASNDGSGRVPLQTAGADIEGLTSTDRILAAAADWVVPGAGAVTFPDAAQAGNEPGVDLGQIFPAV